LNWSYGVTTVPSRRSDLLPRTLASLRAGGFDRPRLFVDGASDLTGWEREFHLPVTIRTSPALRVAGNWVLALYELYIREPTAERYALFQDDMVCYRNLRTYLDQCTYPGEDPKGVPLSLNGVPSAPLSPGYWNLYTFSNTNEPLVKGKKVGWVEAGLLNSSHPELRYQAGRGAVALVFNRKAVTTLLASEHMVSRPQDPHRGWRAVDGAVVTAMNKTGWREYVHAPSLVQHIGQKSSMGNRRHKRALTFRGEEFDALSLLEESCAPT
jgi:hypothetical protein